MACLLAPTAAAIILSGVKKKIAPRYHANWLLALLWGGAAWLIPEHIYHGEIAWYPPFFTAGFSHILAEVLRVGVPMVAAVMLVWAVLATVSAHSKRLVRQPRFALLMLLGALIIAAVDRLYA